MLTIKEAAERVRLSPDTLRAWERRYGVIEPERTAAGYRLYSDTDIKRLLDMRRLIDDGLKPQAAAEYLARNEGSSGDAMQGRPDAPLPSAAVVPSMDGVGQITSGSPNALVAAAIRLDTPALADFFDKLRSLGTFETACEQHLFPALRELGEAWAAGRASVAGEHAASAATLRWLGAQYQAAARDAHSPQVLVGLPPGVLHQLGALAHAVALRRAGLAVLYLGPDLPAEEWIVAARKTEAQVAVIGVPTASDVGPARRVAAAFGRELPGIRLAFGGRGAAALAKGGAVLPNGLIPSVAAVRAFLEVGA